MKPWGMGTIMAATALAERREMLKSRAPCCPRCKTRQVQLRNWHFPLADWKCRGCKHKFVFEPLVQK